MKVHDKQNIKTNAMPTTLKIGRSTPESSTSPLNIALISTDRLHKLMNISGSIAGGLHKLMNGIRNGARVLHKMPNAPLTYTAYLHKIVHSCRNATAYIQGPVRPPCSAFAPQPD